MTNLDMVVKVFLEVFETQPALLPEEDLRVIFGNIRDIKELTGMLFTKLVCVCMCMWCGDLFPRGTRTLTPPPPSPPPHTPVCGLGGLHTTTQPPLARCRCCP